MATTKVQSELIADDVALAGNPTTSTQSAGNNTTRIATTAFVSTAVNNLIDSAPGTMDTLNEIAAALGDDPSFTTTVNNAIATKLPLSGGTMTGDLTIPSKIIHAGDTDTYLRFTNADDFRIVVGNSTRAAFNTSKIHFNQEGIDQDFQVEGQGSGNEYLIYADASTSKVGIGTNSPGKQLTIGGADAEFLLNRTGSYADTINMGMPSGVPTIVGGTDLALGGNGTWSQSLWIKASGKIGVGTDSPGSPLTIKSSATNSTGGLRLLTDSGSNVIASLFGGTNSGVRYGRLELSETSADAINVRLTADPALPSYITAGNFGIGETSPDKHLHIKNTATGSTGIAIENTNNGQNLDIDFYNNSGSAQGRIRYYEGAGDISLNPNVSGSDPFTVKWDGKVGIGTTSPNRHLVLYGTAASTTSIQFQNADTGNASGDGFGVGLDSSEKGFIWNYEGTDTYIGGAGGTSITIKNDGNVGIGEDAPANLLHVKASDTGIAPHTSAQIALEREGTNYLQFLTAENGTSGILFGDGSDVDVSGVVYDHNVAKMYLRAETSDVITIDGTNRRVGIGDTSPAQKLEVSSSSGSNIIRSTGTVADGYRHGFEASNTHTGGTIWSMGSTNNSDGYFGGGKFFIANETMGDVDANTAAKFVIDGSGKVGINIAAPTTYLDVHAPSGVVGPNVAYFKSDQHGLGVYINVGSTFSEIRANNNSYPLVLNASSGGNVGIGTTGPQAKFMVNQATVNEVGGFFYNNTSTNAACLRVLQDGAGSSGPALLVRQDGSGNAITVDDGSDGNTVFSVSQNGALSKASGSFKIDHPLDSKKDTHHLVHSFVEAPQADNIYRGTATLSSGTTAVNLDTVSGMTEGTYVLLNTNTSCFTSNETDWDAVKGSVSGNILTITCQNSSSTATVSWLVIGERHDQHMKDTDLTDDNGKVIVEPLKGEE